MVPCVREDGLWIPAFGNDEGGGNIGASVPQMYGDFLTHKILDSVVFLV